MTLASNPPAYHATKSIWTLDHWQDFGRRCRAMRADIKRFIEYFPLTPGLDAKTYNAIYPLWAKADTACCQAIETFERQYPDRAEESKEIIFADTQRRLFMQFKGSGDSRILSRDEWIGLGIEVKGIHDAAWALAFEFQTAKYARIPMIEKFFKISDQLDNKLKSPLDSLCCKQHPGWKEFMFVFYGRGYSDLSKSMRSAR